MSRDAAGSENSPGNKQNKDARYGRVKPDKTAEMT